MLPDVINPLEGIFASLFHPLETITWPRGIGLTGYQMEMLLRQRGIRCYGRITNDPTVVGLRVRKSQAKWARYIVAARIDGRRLPAAWNAARSAKPHSLIDYIVDGLAWLFGGA